jgi:Helix-hairpin-helix motif
LVSRLRAAAGALFPPEGEEKKGKLEAQSHVIHQDTSMPGPARRSQPALRPPPGRAASDRSRWPYLSLIPFGLGAWAPIYAGQRAQQRSWIAWGALWTIIAVIGFVLAAVTNGGAVAGFLIILGWAGGAATSFSIRGAYDRQMGSPLLQATEAGELRLRDRARALQIARQNPALAREIGIGRPDLPGATDAGLVDINNASVTALLKLPGVEGDAVTAIIEGREKVGGFSSLEDMGAALDLDGPLIEGLRGQVVFLPRAHPA